MPAAATTGGLAAGSSRRRSCGFEGRFAEDDGCYTSTSSSIPLAGIFLWLWSRTLESHLLGFAVGRSASDLREWMDGGGGGFFPFFAGGDREGRLTKLCFGLKPEATKSKLSSEKEVKTTR